MSQLGADQCAPNRPATRGPSSCQGVTVTVAADPRAELVTAIHNANESAERMHDSPAYWARVHERINDWLTDLEQLDA